MQSTKETEMTGQTRSEIRDDMAAIGEQVRKNTETVAEHTRKTMDVAQERVQENVNKMQQAQTEWAKMMFRLSDQNNQLATAAFSSMWDTSLSALKLFTWGEEQMERTFGRAIEQNRLAREEGTALLKETADLARHNQAEMFRLTQEALRVSVFYAGKTGRREEEAVK